MKTTKYQLKNGMQVLLHPSHKSPVVSLQVWVRTGSADELKGEEGISHFIEHLVFKGTSKFKTGEIAQMIEGSGGELNAYTSFDQTVFYITISKSFVDVAFDALSQMMGAPLFDPQEIDNEREVVIEEIKRGLDSPGRRASQLFFSTAYQKHPYGVPVIGFAENVSRWPAKKIVNYFKERYSPKNFFVVVTGDFEEKAVKSKVLQYFGSLKSFVPRKTRRKAEPKWKGLRCKAEQLPFKESSTYMAFPIPSVKHKDVPALDVLSMILGHGDSSRLTQKLRLERPLVNGVGASTWTPQDEGAFLITLNSEKEKIPEALKIAIGEVVRLTEDYVTQEELEKARVILSSDQIYGIETVDGIARRIGSYEFYLKDPDHFVKFMKQINDLTVEDLRAVARKYLTPERVVLTTTSEYSKEEAEKILKAAYSDFKKEFAKKPLRIQPGKSAPSKNSGIQKIVLPQGTTVLLKSEKETPTLSMRIGFLGGSRSVPADKMGLVELLSRIWTSSSSKRRESEIHKLIDSTASGLSAFGGRNSFGLNLDCLSSMFPQMGDLLEELLLEPGLDPTHLDRERVILQNQIKSKWDHPSTVASRQFMQTIFASHPYSLDPLGTQETVQGLQTKDLQNYFSGFACASNMTVAVVGDFNETELLSRIERIAGALPKGKKYSQIDSVAEIKQNKFVYSQMNKEQSHLIMGYHGLSVDSPERYVLQLLDSVLSGMGGRLFNELREKNSLAYSVAPQKLMGVGAGSFGAYIGCSPDKVDKALQMMLVEFKKLVEWAVPEEELERCRRYLIGSHDIDLQRKSSLATNILFEEIYGLNSNEIFEAEKIFREISAKQVKTLAEKIFSQKFVCSVVGQKDLEFRPQ